MADSQRDEDIRGEDTRHYGRYTGPQRLDKALHTLEGLLKGIALDGAISVDEVQGVRKWMAEHAEHADQT